MISFVDKTKVKLNIMLNGRRSEIKTKKKIHGMPLNVISLDTKKNSM